MKVSSRREGSEFWWTAVGRLNQDERAGKPIRQVRAKSIPWTAGNTHLAAKTPEGAVPTLPRLRRMDDAEILSWLVAVRGIGSWTVEMLLNFRLGRPDVLPASDLGVRKGFMLT